MATATNGGSVGLVEKQRLTLPRYTCENGATIEEVAVGYETYGTRAPSDDNVILVCHHYSGTAHAAGRYTPDDELLGYWDGLIGPGKALDTSRYFVVAMDALGNVNVNDPRVVTVGPATQNPATGERYGTAFPQFTIRDMVRVQRAALDRLGIEHLAAVIGPSMGGEQTLEWGVTYPDLMDRLVAVIAGPHTSPRLNILFLAHLEDAVTLDPAYRQGDYAPDAQPLAGLTLGFSILLSQAYGEAWAEQQFGRRPADPARDPYQDRAAQFAFQTELRQLAEARARLTDANQLLWLNRANMLHDLAHGYASAEEAYRRIAAPLLAINVTSDLWFPPAQAFAFVAAVNAVGGRARGVAVETASGHIAGLVETERFADELAAFLDAPVRR